MEWSQSFQRKDDFVTNIRYDQTSNICLLIHDEPTVDVIPGFDAVRTYLNNSDAIGRTISFESPVYDVVSIRGCLLSSNCNMPVRLYKVPQEADSPLEWSSITDRMPNSQKYLTPIQFAVYGDTVIGGGKKFLTLYDLNKLAAKKRPKQMHKRYVSSVELLNENELVAGQFNGELTFLDLRAEDAAVTIKPHIDLVTRIKRVPNSSHQFVTLARKDNYAYLWDMRNMQTFVQVYEQPLYGNQRTGLQISSDGQTAYFGDQNGKITAKRLSSSTQLFEIQTFSLQCVSSLCFFNSKLLAAVGSRCFPLACESSAPHSNLLCCLNAGLITDSIL